MDLICLALTIFLEARGEPLAGQYAVGQVVLNRTASEDYPDSVCEVVAQPHQFAPPRQVKGEPVAKWIALSVAADLLFNYTPNTEVLWFYNPHKASPVWADRLQPVSHIGRHLFLRRKT